MSLVIYQCVLKRIVRTRNNLQHPLSSLALRRCKIESIDAMTDALQGSSIRSLYLSQNLIKSIDSLARVLPFTQIHHLSVFCNHLTDVDCLWNVLNKTNLDSIDLSGNKIRNVDVLIREIQHNKKLSRVDLRDNQINFCDISRLLDIQRKCYKHIDFLVDCNMHIMHNYSKSRRMEKLRLVYQSIFVLIGKSVFKKLPRELYIFVLGEFFKI